MKKNVFRLPDILLSIAFAVVGISELLLGRPSPVGYICIGIALLFLLLMKFKLRVLSIAFCTIMCLIAFYFELAVISEFIEFPAFTFDAFTLIATGSLLCGAFGILSFLILRRNFLEFLRINF